MKNIYMKMILCILAGCLLAEKSQGQDYLDSFKATRIVKLDSLSDSVYRLIRPYNLIMIGESHGTKESASFVIGLMKILVEHGDSVQIGLEIKESQVKKFIESPNEPTLLRSNFFSKEKRNPQASQAWADLILCASRTEKTRLFFFDVDYSDYNKLYPRDSAMYLNIKQLLKTHPSWKTITLTGNIHSLPDKYNDIPTLGYYLSTDSEIVKFSRMISIVHRYKIGELWDSSGLLPQEYEKHYEDLPYTKRLGLKSYLLILPNKTNSATKSLFYTESTTRSKIIWNE